MSFLWPTMLSSLILVPLLAVGYVALQRRRRRMAARYSSLGFVLQSGGRPIGARRHVPAIVFLLAITILLVATARPQSELLLPRVEGTIILAFDVSGSMAADDVKPSRLDAAKEAARDFVRSQPSTVRIGVVTFSEGGFSTQAPTSNTDEVLAAIDRLAVQRGTSVARGIEAALNVIAVGRGDEPLTLSERTGPTAAPVPVARNVYTSSVVVLLTDGENTQDPDPMDAAQEAMKLGVRVYAVGVGTPQGAILKLDGFSVRSRLQEDALKQIAQVTGGLYQSAQNKDQLRAIYDTIQPEIVVKARKTEITSVVAGVGILVMMLGGMLSVLWLGRLP